MSDNDNCWPCEEEVIEKLPGCPLQCRTERCKAFKKKPSFEGKPIIWILGCPGVGKGVQCDMATAKYGFKNLVVNDLVQNEIRSQSTQGRCLNTVVERGEVPPSDQLLSLLKTAVFADVESAKGFIVKGYPREKRQGVQFEKQIAPVSIILYLEASTELLLQRLLNRAMNQGRVDINQLSILAMLKKTRQNNELILAYYPDKVERINADRTAEEIFRDVSTILDAIVSQKIA